MATKKRTTNGGAESKRVAKVNLAAADGDFEVDKALWVAALKLLLRDLMDGDVKKAFNESDAFVKLVRRGESVRNIAAFTGMPRNQIVAQLVALARC